ncbi:MULTISPECIES: sigma-70 family RNA polymerase sigma factor [Bacillus]|uniref:Sigma-70 family RNA polymerase sigma factor n=1 Tax=Bacillus wiedmannii TaxID=1890302 RepID=A0AB37YPI5_9BACI|nr:MULTISPECIES: sigma-70 family RNA polymerase sigma factor [Bacillus]EJS65431.1 sigma-70 family RNA polymerase sigma factor [Bacillus wiedmannii]EJV67591.1 sigma-70 family RNA polymerase sigma factor [Bacillus wiedmannii]MDR4943556.1 sigma-70 family RNA polymerase sigma factor [Bacillus wiedmannii]MED3314962.1 sigma-70 family RNA polymerase sigma factor [Bacillus wiedmannii]OAK15880.1 RNA polymerase subunit sigma-70 [Bacillus wiedmannii]
MKSNEKNFIKRLQRQKEDALEFVVDTYLPLIKGITHKVLLPVQNDGLIEECINDIFLSIWNNANKFHGEPNDFKKWIAAIAKFKAIDYYRKATNKVEIISDEFHISTEKSAEDELIVMEDREELMQLLNQLEPLDQKVFIMKYLLGMKTEEIGEKLGLTRAAIDNRVYRGKKKLQQNATKISFGGSAI